MEVLDELCDFITPETRLDVKTLALHHVLSMTGSVESKALLLSHKKILDNILTLAFKSNEQNATNKDAFFTLINLSADEHQARQLLDILPDLIDKIIDYICKEESRFSDAACGVLSNLSRTNENCKIIAKYFTVNDSNNNEEISSRSLESLLKCFCTENFNKSNSLNYLAPFICNLTQLEEIREIILKENIILLRLLPYTTFAKSVIRRGGIIGAIKNCCFNYDHHEHLLQSPEIDILSRLLLPLAGPEEFDAEDTDKLPDDLQYLPPTKEREEDADIRSMLIETLMLLASRKSNRDYIKEKNAYVIMRELHKWETDSKAKAVCEKFVQILISDEPEKENENYEKVMIPEHLSKKFYEFDIAEMGNEEQIVE